MVMLGSNTCATSSATVPSNRCREANSSGSVVRRSNHHGVQRALGDGPDRQRGRHGEAVAHVAQPRPGHGHVDGEHQRLVPGGRGTRQKSRLAARSRHRYSWNHCRASGAAAASPSIDVVPIVDSAYGMPCGPRRGPRPARPRGASSA